MESVNKMYISLLSKFFGIENTMSKKYTQYNGLGALLLFVVVLVCVFMIAWALGETLCWQHGASHFQFYNNLGHDWMFQIGCK